MTPDVGRIPGGRHPRVPAWVGDVIAAFFIIASAFLPFTGLDFGGGGALTLALVVAPAVILTMRRRWPVPVLAACIALYAAAAFTQSLWPGIVLATAIAMFGAANRLPRRAALITALIAIGVIVTINVLASLTSLLDLRAFAVAVTVAFAAAAGDGARSWREYIDAITERAERAERTRESEARRRVSEERLRIARDLHDAVAHQIAVISLNAGVASSTIDARPEAAHEAVRTIRAAARTVLGEIGTLLDVLRTDDDDPATSPQPGLERLDDLVGLFTEAGLTVTVRTDGDLAAVGGATSLVAYRVIQESLTNALKHGVESRAHLLLQAEDDVLRVVVTNPVVPSPEPARTANAAGSGLGLVGLRERVAAVRGVIEIGPNPGGWRVTAILPLTKAGDV